LAVPIIVHARMQQRFQLTPFLRRELVNRFFDFRNRAHGKKVANLKKTTSRRGTGSECFMRIQRAGVCRRTAVGEIENISFRRHPGQKITRLGGNYTPFDEILIPLSESNTPIGEIYTRLGKIDIQLGGSDILIRENMIPLGVSDIPIGLRNLLME